MLIRDFELLAVDVDGTITGPDLGLDLTAVKVLRELGKRVKVALVTGNAYPIALSIFRYVRPSGERLIIAENGGAIIVNGDVRKHPDGGLKDRVIGYLRERGYERLISEDTYLRVADVALRGDELTLMRIKAELEERFPEAVIRYSGYALHVMPKGVNKGSGLVSLCEMTGVPCSKVVAIGDSYNDIDMFEVAGFSIALPQAPKEVKDRANMVAPGKGYGESLTLALALLLNSL